jgi:hypothetical protein
MRRIRKFSGGVTVAKKSAGFAGEIQNWVEVPYISLWQISKKSQIRVRIGNAKRLSFENRLGTKKQNPRRKTSGVFRCFLCRGDGGKNQVGLVRRYEPRPSFRRRKEGRG